MRAVSGVPRSGPPPLSGSNTLGRPGFGGGGGGVVPRQGDVTGLASRWPIGVPPPYSLWFWAGHAGGSGGGIATALAPPPPPRWAGSSGALRCRARCGGERSTAPPRRQGASARTGSMAEVRATSGGGGGGGSARFALRRREKQRRRRWRCGAAGWACPGDGGDVWISPGGTRSQWRPGWDGGTGLTGE